MTASSKNPAKTGNTYSRFIPREEIDAVASWQFAAVDGSETLPPLPVDPEPEPAPDLAAVQQALQAAREQAWAEGYAQGHEAGGRETRDALEASVRQHAEQTAVRMAQLLHGMTDQLIGAEQKVANQILELACDLARQVVRQELKVNTRHLRPVIAEALEQIIDDGLPATVRMHPDDLARMKGGLLETLGENAPEFVADPGVTPGGCLVQTPSMTVDASIEKRWTRAMANLGLSLEWNPEGAHD